MSINSSISSIITSTIDTTNRYQVRLQELAILLNIIHWPLTSEPTRPVQVNNDEYCFDDLLVLMFEFVQLIKIFKRFEYAEQSLQDFLTYHAQRLAGLCLEGRLAYLDEMIQFRKEMTCDVTH